MQQDMHDCKRRIARDYRENMHRRGYDNLTWGSFEQYEPDQEDGPRETSRSSAVLPVDISRDDTSNEDDNCDWTLTNHDVRAQFRRHGP